MLRERTRLRVSVTASPYIDLHTHAVDVKLAAIEAALSALAGSMGADANAIAKAVSEAVEKKLEAIDLTVTVND